MSRSERAGRAARPTVAVTGLEGRDNPYPGAAIARALRAARGDGVRILGLGYEPLLTGGFRADLFDAVHATPLPGAPAATLIPRLLEIHRAEPIDVLIPALDSELALFAEYRAELAAAGIRMAIPSAAAVKRRYKQRLAAWARAHGLFSPRTEVVTDPATFWRQEEWSFPCFLKGPLADAVEVSCQAEAEAVFQRLAARWGLPVLAQEALRGHEIDVCAVVRPGGEPLAMLSMRKTALSAAGKAIAAEVIADPVVEAEARRILAALDWEGPLELELLREHSSGRLFLLEINARFPAWIGIAPATGVNLPDLLLRLALAEELPAIPPPHPVRFLRASRTTLGRVEQLGALLATGRLDHRDPS